MSSVASVATLSRATTTSAATRPSSITTPPIVGVPALMRCVSGPSSRTNWPNLRVCKNSMNVAPSITVTRNAMAAARTTLNKGQALFQLPGKSVEAHTPRTLDHHVIARLQPLPEVARRRIGVRVEDRLADEGLRVPSGLVADAHKQVDARLLGKPPRLLVVGAGGAAELEHAAEYRHEPPSLAGGLIRSVTQHRGYGRGRCVVGVVVDHDIVSQPVHLPTQTRRSEEHTSELQSRQYLVCRLLLEKKKKIY